MRKLFDQFSGDQQNAIVRSNNNKKKLFGELKSKKKNAHTKNTFVLSLATHKTLYIDDWRVPMTACPPFDV